MSDEGMAEVEDSRFEMIEAEGDSPIDILPPEAVADPVQAVANLPSGDFLTNYFSRYLDVNLPMPAERDPALKGYMVDVDAEAYRAFPAVNNGLLSEATTCEMLYSLFGPRTDEYGSPAGALAKTLGTVLHWAVLEPRKFDESERDKYMQLCITDGLSTKKAQAQREDAPHLLLVTPRLVQSALRCIDAIQANPRAVELLNPKGKVTEATGIVMHPNYGVWCKSRVDLLPPNNNYLLDVKTTGRPLSMFNYEAKRLGYIQQAAWYLHLHYLLTGEYRAAFRWVVVTTKPPFMARTFYLRNLTRRDHMYEDSALCKARQLIGIEDGMRIPRLASFLNAVNETLQMVSRAEITPKLLRSIWVGYEQEQPEQEIYD